MNKKQILDYCLELDNIKENKLPEEDTEKLKKKQIDVLGYGADDLYIREEIAELEDKLKELIEEV